MAASFRVLPLADSSGWACRCQAARFAALVLVALLWSCAPSSSGVPPEGGPPAPDLGLDRGLPADQGAPDLDQAARDARPRDRGTEPGPDAAPDAIADRGLEDFFAGGLTEGACRGTVLPGPSGPTDTFAHLVTLDGLVTAVADLDGDGRDDIVSLLRLAQLELPTPHLSEVSVWFSQDQDGVWARVGEVRGGRVGAAADITGDGRPEILVNERTLREDPHNPNTWTGGITLRQDPIGRPPQAPAFPEYLFVRRDIADPPYRHYIFSSVHQVGFVDVDGDGAQEIVGVGPLTIYRQQDGVWSEIYQDFDDYNNNPLSPQGHFAAGDFDGDGAMELVVVGHGPVQEFPGGGVAFRKHLRVLEADGEGGLVLRHRRITPSVYESALVAGDPDGDGRPDFLVAADMYPTCFGAYLYSAVGNDDFALRWSLEIDDPAGFTLDSGKAAFGDTDGDGDDELAIATGYTVRVFEWQDDDFVPIFEYRGCEACRDTIVHFGDVDGDGRAELVINSMELGFEWQVNEGTPAVDTLHVFKRVMSSGP